MFIIIFDKSDFSDEQRKVSCFEVKKYDQSIFFMSVKMKVSKED